MSNVPNPLEQAPFAVELMASVEVTDADQADLLRSKVAEALAEFNVLTYSVKLPEATDTDVTEELDESSHYPEAQGNDTLRMDVLAALTEHMPEQQNLRISAYNLLARQGVKSMADILMVGRERIVSSPNAVASTVRSVESLLAAAGFTEWKDRPTVEDAVALYEDLGQIPYQVVANNDVYSVWNHQTVLDVMQMPREQQIFSLGKRGSDFITDFTDKFLQHQNQLQTAGL